MKLRKARRLERIPPYLFMELRNKISEARAAGMDVISLAIGDPVEPTPREIIDELCRAAHVPENHRYPTDEEKGMAPLRQEVCRWYAERYGVELDGETECLILLGSKEGCHHFALGMVNPGDVVLVTDPGYPGYKPSIWLADAEPYSVPIKAAGGFLPDLRAIPGDVAERASAFYLNYPNNPTGAVATPSFLRELVSFAKENSISICYDNPYIEIVFEDTRPLSILSLEGAKDVAVELNSFSKPFNMTGWRLGMAVGNPTAIAAMAQVKANTDSGVFNAIQYAGIEALRQCATSIDEELRIYERRRRLVVDTLNELGWDYAPPKGTFYLWVPTPDGKNSVAFASEVFEKARVVVAPGSAYGEYGEGYVRLSLTVPDDQLQEAMRRMRGALR